VFVKIPGGAANATFFYFLSGVALRGRSETDSVVRGGSAYYLADRPPTAEPFAPSRSTPVISRDLTGPRLAALAAFGWMLLTPPILWAVDRPILVLGAPLLYLWLFGVWAALIAATAWLVERHRPASPDEPAE
jgi:hypothetical protein